MFDPYSFGGMRVMQREHAVTNRRNATLFEAPPFSRNRSRRVWKKLRKKTARVEVLTDPAALRTPQGLIVHPALYAALRARTTGADQ